MRCFVSVHGGPSRSQYRVDDDALLPDLLACLASSETKKKARCIIFCKSRSYQLLLIGAFSQIIVFFFA